ncbi:tRNA (5-methylaminomethyl-2-thiouridine)(34)-methyltransferase MnmD [Orbaceae bacterium ac157xtp]
MQTPISKIFDDVYFNSHDAIAETQYVFIEGNNLYQRFLTHNNESFSIGETGFGSGLNFILARHCFNQFKENNPNHILKTLQFYSVEKYPLIINDMQQIHKQIIKCPALQELATQLQNSWSNSYLQFNNVELNILFADINEFPSYLKNQKAQIDAWFFDGFSPAKNPDMWSELLFKQLLTVTNKNGTFSTFTAAGYVKRNLINAGFSVYKQKGYGKKREMLIGKKS